MNIQRTPGEVAEEIQSRFHRGLGVGTIEEAHLWLKEDITAALKQAYLSGRDSRSLSYIVGALFRRINHVPAGAKGSHEVTHKDYVMRSWFP